MSLAVNTSISALHALGTRQSVTANNIATSETTGFKKSTTILAEGANGAVMTKAQPVNTPGTMINQPDGSLEEMSNVDLGQELISTISTKNAYEANLKALQTSMDMEDTVLDLIG
ncbi:MAG: flagellar basal body rod C-terminal domain-containing protein [Thermodesulfobacteriota bacterium]|nr:flagellar basal body rod C-terminal domain-containing protein [Thermodesulfobacteriota bacterium]